MLVMRDEARPYGAFEDAGPLVDTQARGGLGRITIANTPEQGGSSFDAGGVITGEIAQGVLNSEYTVHSDRHVITTSGLGMHGFKANNLDGPTVGDMLLVSAPVGTSGYLQLGNYNRDWDDPGFDPPFYTPGSGFDIRSAGDAAVTLGLDHHGKLGLNDDLGLWELVAEAKLLDDPIEARDYHVDFYGRGASAVLGGAVALMLEANPGLGWRDVQAILAYSANPLDVGDIPFFDESVDWPVRIGPDRHWNGGGLMHSSEYGFGSLDTHAAVRLAETWGEPGEGARTSRNEKVVTARPVAGSELDLGVLNEASRPGNDWTTGPSGASIRFRVPGDVEIEHVAVELEFTARNWRGGMADEVGIHLIAPGGDKSHLAALAEGGIHADVVAGEAVDHTFTTRAFWGREAERGDVWTLRFEGGFRDDPEVEVQDVRLRFHGAPADRDDVYVYTDALVQMSTAEVHESHADRGDTLAEASGHGGRIRDGRGRDVLNASAMTHDLDLEAGPRGRGKALEADGNRDVRLYDLARGTAMDVVHAGDGNDRITGWRGDERLSGGRGRDRLEGRAGEDRLEGGAGRDWLAGGEGRDRLEGGRGPPGGRGGARGRGGRRARGRGRARPAQGRGGRGRARGRGGARRAGGRGRGGRLRAGAQGRARRGARLRPRRRRPRRLGGGGPDAPPRHRPARRGRGDRGARRDPGARGHPRRQARRRRLHVLSPPPRRQGRRPRGPPRRPPGDGRPPTLGPEAAPPGAPRRGRRQRVVSVMRRRT